MWKKLLFLIFLFTAYAFTFAKADNTIVDVIINGKYADFNSVYAHLIDNKTFIPIRAVSNITGFDVEWNSYKNSVTISSEDKKAEFKNNSKTYYLNGNTHYLNSECVIKDGTFYVPARDFFDIFGISFTWDSKYYSIIIDDENINLTSANTKYDYEEDHIFWLARIIHAESLSEPLIGKVAVGNVVLNRVKSSDFPNTIYTVIFDTKYGVQYEPVINNTIYNNPSAESIKAAKFSLNGFNAVGDCLYFFNPKTATSTWIKENRTYYTTIGNHDFYV